MLSIIKKNKLPLSQLIIIFTGILLYSNTYDVPFHLDDFVNILGNEAIKINKLTYSNINKIVKESPISSRPIANISFALNYFLHQFDVFGYHLFNITIHIAAGLFLFLLIRLTLQTPAIKLKFLSSQHIAFWSTILWLAHPIQTQSVTYIVQRMNSLAALFYLIATYFYVKGRFSQQRQRSLSYFILTGFVWLLAIGSKEIALAFPFLIYIYEWIFFQKGEIRWLKKSAPYLIGLITIFLFIVILYLGKEPWQNILQSYDHRPFSLKERLLTEFRVIFFYISLLLLPTPGRLGLEHDFALSSSLLHPMTTFLSCSGICFLIIYAFFVARNRPLISFSILWFLGNLLIESSVISLEIIFEHRLYLPSMFFFLPFIFIIINNSKFIKVSVVLIMACFVLFGSSTYARNKDWKDPIEFWRKNVNTAPKSARAHNNLGRQLMREGEFSESKKHLEEAIRLDPSYVKAHVNLGMLGIRQRRFDVAERNFLNALQYNPKMVDAHVNLGGLYTDTGSYKKALFHLKKALVVAPSSSIAHNNMANLMFIQKRYRRAIFHYDEAIRLNPQNYQAVQYRQYATEQLMKREKIY